MKEVTIYEVREVTKTIAGDYVEFQHVAPQNISAVRNADELCHATVETQNKQVHLVHGKNGPHYYVVNPQLEKLGFNVDALRREQDRLNDEVRRLRVSNRVAQGAHDSVVCMNEHLVSDIARLRNASLWQRIKWVFTGVI